MKKRTELMVWFIIKQWLCLKNSLKQWFAQLNTQLAFTILLLLVLIIVIIAPGAGGGGGDTGG